MTITPEQFQARVLKQAPAAAYLFLGQEGYQRRICKEALAERVLPGDARSEGFTQVDLEDVSLTEVLDDARSLSLFAGERLIWVRSAELALPRRLTSGGEGGEEGEKQPDALLKEYLANPTAGTVLVFECSRYDFAGEDKAKLDRVQKFYSAVPVAVEFRHYTPDAARFLAHELAKEHGLKLAGAELAALLDAVAGDANRLASEIEKLSLFAAGGTVTMDDLRALVPSAAQSTIFSLVNALGRRDRARALESLDILVREGEYLPLALTFLSGQFRMALAAKEAKITSAQQAQSFFTRSGVRIWRERAEQVVATADAFSQEHLARAVGAIYETDKKFRDGYRDDQTIMEMLVMTLTASR